MPPNSGRPRRAVSLFSGAGGLDLGLDGVLDAGEDVRPVVVPNGMSALAVAHLHLRQVLPDGHQLDAGWRPGTTRPGLLTGGSSDSP